MVQLLGATADLEHTRDVLNNAKIWTELVTDSIELTVICTAIVYIVQ